MRKPNLNILLYSIIGILSISICVLLVKIANRPRYLSDEDSIQTIEDVSSLTDYPEESVIESAVMDSSTEPIDDSVAPKVVHGKTSAKVNIRELPDINSRILMTVDQGYTFEILEILDEGWVEITYENGYGYISSDYVIITN